VIGRSRVRWFRPLFAAVIKRLALAALHQPAVVRWLSATRRAHCAVFMLHRFASADGRRAGHDPAALHRLLQALRAGGVRFASLDDVMASVAGDRPLPPGPTVAFSVDDCYPDFAKVGMPVFEANACPVTGFVVPDVVEQRCWFWWDQVEYILQRARSSSLAVPLAGASVTVSWTDDVTRRAAGRTFTEALKPVPAEALERGVQALAHAAGVSLPEAPPAEYRVLDWDELRALETRGARLGAHTLTHPLLSRCDDARAEREILGSVDRVRTELRDPSMVFAYPVGRATDFGTRDEALVERAGLIGAVSAVAGRPPAGDGRHTRWRVPRFAHDERPGAAARLLLL
jgi:peptidoglycan/xylan/chitin deacetylase (PgdA/CDA1 family)